MNCPYCNTLIEEDFNFCPSCEQQVKCLSCTRELIAGKTKCLYCGTPIGTNRHRDSQQNTFTLEEKQTEKSYSRKINLAFSDEAIDKAAPLLSGYVNFARTRKVPVSASEAPIPALPAFESYVEGEPSPLGPDDDLGKSSQLSSVEAIQTTTSRARDFFEQDSQGYLVSTTPDYKGKTKRMQQERFCLLYVMAYTLTYGEPVPGRSHLLQAARINGIYDTNFPSNLSRIAKLYFIRTDGTFKLNPGGHLSLETILSEMTDAELTGNNYWTNSSKPTSKGARISKADREKINKWVAVPSRLASFDVRKLDTAIKWCLLAIHDITKELKVEESVKPGVAFEYISKRYKTIPIGRKSFTDAIGRKEYRTFLGRTNNGSYYLESAGEQEVSSILSSQSTVTPVAS